MKEMFVKMVCVEDTAKMEKYLNRLQVGLHDWDKTKVFNYNGYNVVNYTIICTKEIIDTLDAIMSNS